MSLKITLDQHVDVKRVLAELNYLVGNTTNKQDLFLIKHELKNLLTRIEISDEKRN